MSEYIYERPDGPAKVIRDGWNVRIEWDFEQREEVVRCRDCEWFDEKGLCRRDMSCDELAVSAGPNGFCAWPKRRES